MDDIETHAIYFVINSSVCNICTSNSHSSKICPMLQTFLHLRIQHQPHIKEDTLAPRTPRVSLKPALTHHQSTITKIIPPPNANNTQHHIQFISSSIGMMICVVFSSFFDVDTTKITTILVPLLTGKTHPIFTFSTFLGSMESTTESLSFLSFITKNTHLLPRDLTQPSSTLYKMFHSRKAIMEAMMDPQCPWDAMHHHPSFLDKKYFVPLDAPTHDVCTIESKDLLPSRQVDWF